MFKRAKNVIHDSALKPTAYYAQVAEKLRTPFIDLGGSGAKGKHIHVDKLEALAVTAELTKEQRKELTRRLNKSRIEVVDYDVVFDRSIEFIRECAAKNTENAPRVAA